MKDYGRNFLGDVEGAVPSMVNPKAMSQGVAMTAAASGSSGITVADNDNIDMATNNFAPYFDGLVPDFTPAANLILMQKLTGGVGYQLEIVATTGIIRLTLNATAYNSSVAPTAVDGTKHKIVPVVTVGAVNTTVDFYFDAVALGVQQTAANPGTVSNAAALYILGTSAVRTAGTASNSGIFNRALSAAEVLDLYRNGISEADKWGSQTSIITGNDSTFAGASNWANVSINAYDETGDLTVSSTATSQYCTLPVANAGMTYGKKYRLTATGSSLSGDTFGFRDFEATYLDGSANITILDGTNSYEFTYLSAGAGLGGLSVIASGTGSLTLDNITLVEIGATLALEEEGIQPNPGQWLDSSSNKLHAWQPAVGSSLTRYKNTFEIRGRNTWAGTHEAQSIFWATDASRAILPVDCYITDIIGVITGATIEDIIIGDGSDTDRWVTITTGLAAGTTAFTVANRISDGTNYEMVVDPDANFTGTIEWTIKGIILE